MTVLSKLWDLIEGWGFRESIKDIEGIDNNDDDNKEDDNDNNDNSDNNNNDDQGMSALGRDKDLIFSQNYQGHHGH